MDITISDQMIDIAEPQIVEVMIRADRKVIWVNVDGICRLRVCMIPKLILDDQSKSIPHHQV